MRAPSAEFCSRAAWVVWLTYSLAITAGLVLLGPWMQPVRRGTANDFWETACGIELDSTPRNEWGGAAYCVDENWVAYDWPHMHGSDIYYVPMAEARPRFEAATRALAARQVSGADSRFVKGYEQWRAKPADRQTMESLLDCQRDALHEAANARGIHALSYLVSVEQLFWQRWRRARWYWANFIFEWFFLTGLGLFALWPVIRNSNLYRWAAHVSLLPLLFLLPTYLGYATTSFTSAGPSGGVLYPFLVCFFHGGRTNVLDGWVLGRLPQVLEPLSASQGAWIASTGMGMPGPSWAIQVGLFLAAVVLVAGLIVRHRRMHPAGKSTIPVK